MDAVTVEIPIEATFVFFAERLLSMSLYGWQADAITPFDYASVKTARVTTVTPNESGKSSVLIPTLVLGWLFRYPRGKVVLTTADGRQIDSQVMPAIEKHRAKFPSWKFIEREIQTPTGGSFVAFTTDQPGRAEGWHREDDIDGPLLMIVDEAKSVPDEIFLAIDRCGYNGLLLTSSPGKMIGRFYESHQSKGFSKIKVGLLDCPHIKQDKIQWLKDQHGPDAAFPNPSFLASTLHGEFMAEDGALRFNREGLDKITEDAKAFEKNWRLGLREHPETSVIGELNETRPDSGEFKWMSDYETGWMWMSEGPIPGCQYMGFCDSTTGIQSIGSLHRDTAGVGILRLGYTDHRGPLPITHDDEVVAVLHHEGGVRWENDIVGERFAWMLKYYKCPAIVEMNNYGGEMILILQQAGCDLWRRTKRNHKNPGKKLDVVGFQTTAASKNEWVGALGRSIREQSLVCNYLPAAQQFGTFILNDKGTGEASSGNFDDFVTGVGLALYARDSATVYQRMGMPMNIIPLMGGAMVLRGPEYAQQGQGACS